MNYIKLICKECDKSFDKLISEYNFGIKRGQDSFCCSRKCADKWKSKHFIRKNSKVEMVCDHCGFVFNQYISQRRGDHSFCSQQCRFNFFKGENCHNYNSIEVTCTNCGKSHSKTKYNYDKSSNHFCSNNCWHEFMIGENSPNWKGGMSEEMHKLRNSKRGLKWKKQVMEKYNYRCIVCGSKEGIHCHHLNSFTKFENLRYDIDNGVCVCSDCHYSFHKKYTTNKFTEENFYDFLTDYHGK